MKRVLLVILPLILFGSCYKEAKKKIDRIHGVKWSGTYAISAINADLNLDDAVEIFSGPANTGAYFDKTIYFAYEATEISKTGSQLYPLNDQNGTTSAALTNPEKATLTGAGSVTTNRSFVFPFVMTGIPELDSVYFSKGNFSLAFQNNYDHPCTVTLKIVQARRKNSGSPDLIYNLNVGSRATGNINDSLSNIILDATKGGTGFNELRMDLSITYTNSGAGIGISDNFNINYNLNSLQFSRIYGYFGNLSVLNANDSLSLDIFDQGLKYGTFRFDDPKLKLIYTHNMGMPFQLKTNSLSGYKPAGTTPVVGYPATTAISEIPFGSEGNFITDSVVISHPSSNIQTVIKNEPTHILYNFNVIPNPGGPVKRNFVLANSTFKVKVMMELPLNGLATKVLLIDTTDFDLNAGKASEVIDWVNFRMNIHNEIPITLGFQAYFMDANSLILDSLFEPFRYIANSATIDGSGNVIAPYDEIYDVYLEKDKIQNIQNAKKLMFKAFMNTAESGGTQVPVRITQNQHLKVKMGIHTKVAVNEKF
ncbi:MAG: hypothetical protein KG003_04255 [Bacteroidetes bacterium]|nr:hypothetical protein [Bacteroidota bacterium]